MMKSPECADLTPKILHVRLPSVPICYTGEGGAGRAEGEGIFSFCLMPLSHSVRGWRSCQSDDPASMDQAEDTRKPI